MKKIERIGDRTRVSTVNNTPTRTQQQFRDQVDVNNIIAKYKKTGEWQHLTHRQGVYADVSNITDYQTSLNKVIRANAAFASLPAQIRLRFENDPSKLLAFMQDPQNYDEGVKLGLIEPKEQNQAVSNSKTNQNDNENAPPPKKLKAQAPETKKLDEE